MKVSKKKAFTLTELLVVVIIIGVLSARSVYMSTDASDGYTQCTVYTDNCTGDVTFISCY